MNTVSSSFPFLVLLLGLLWGFTGHAGTVTQVKNEKVLIDFAGETPNVGEKYFLLENTKKVGIVELIQVKNQKAIGKLTKGKSAVGFQTALGAKAKQPTTESDPAQVTEDVNSFLRFDRMKYSVQMKLFLNKISTKQRDNAQPFPHEETVTMNGTNFGVFGTLELPLFDPLQALGFAGIEMLDVVGSAQYNSCDSKSSTNCDMKITYITVGGIARYDFKKSKINPWAGIGISLKYPVIKKSTALDEDSLQFANTVIFTGGLDYHLNNKNFVPVALEYHYSTNTSETVPVIDQWALTAGYGFKF